MKKLMQINAPLSQRPTELTWEEQNVPSHLLRDDCVERLTEALESARSLGEDQSEQD